jgi:lipopolysaccharide biosynthesis glycosyltransferase
MKRSVFIGWDPREADAWEVCARSMQRRMSERIQINKLELSSLVQGGLYSRPTSRKGARLIDGLSKREDYDGSMSTEHAIARFFVPLLAEEGWALFMDGDMLVRGDICEVFEGLDETKALYCVQHDHRPAGDTKMDGQVQTRYRRKNWSSFMIFNCDKWTPEVRATYLVDLNLIPGRDLHAFAFLEDHEIGRLDQKWNFLVGYTDSRVDPAVVHFTEGLPDMPGYRNVLYADEWRAELALIKGLTEAAE